MTDWSWNSYCGNEITLQRYLHFGETWGFRNMAVFCVLWVGKSFYPFTRSWKWHSLFWKGREHGAVLSSLPHLCRDLAAGTSQAPGAGCVEVRAGPCLPAETQTQLMEEAGAGYSCSSAGQAILLNPCQGHLLYFPLRAPTWIAWGLLWSANLQLSILKKIGRVLGWSGSPVVPCVWGVCYGLNCLPKIHVVKSLPNTAECDLIWKQELWQTSLVKMRVLLQWDGSSEKRKFGHGYTQRKKALWTWNAKDCLEVCRS